MSKPLKKLTSIFTHSERHIKYDGSGYHSGPIKSIFERPGFNASLLASLGCVTIGLIQQGNFDITTAKMLGVMGGCVFGTLLATIGEHAVSWPKNALFNKAVDTKGQDLSRAQLGLPEIILLDRHYQSGRFSGMLNLMMGMFNAFNSLYDANALSSFGTCLCLGVGGLFYAYSLRAYKLIKGHTTNEDNVYVFCDKPPAKTVKEKKPVHIFGKALNPN